MLRNDPHEPPPAAPSPFRQTTPYTLEMEEGGGCMSLFGLPFFLAGVFLALAAAGFVALGGDGAQPWARPVVGLMAAVFLAVGGGLVFGRRWISLDRMRSSAIRRTGLLVPMQSEERSLAEFNAVVLGFEAGDSDSSDHYPVRLRAMSGKDFALCSPTEFGAARKQAEFLAGFLALPLADATTDHEVLIRPERVGETLQQRLLSDASKPESAARPAQMRSEVEESSGGARIVLTGRSPWLAATLLAVVPAVVALAVIPALWTFFRRTGTPDGVGFVFVVFLAAAFIITPLAMMLNFVRTRTNRTVVTASPAGLVIERQLAGKSTNTTIAAADILDIDSSTPEAVIEAARRSAGMSAPEPTPAIVQSMKKWLPTKGIMIKSRAGLFGFGEGLPPEELRYLQSVLNRALTGR